MTKPASLQLTLSALLVAGIAACEPPRNLFAEDAGADGSVAGDGSGGDGAGDGALACDPRRIYCDANRSYRCDRQGHRIDEHVCEGTTPNCALDHGCVTCMPGTSRCDPDHTDVPQSCMADGSRWSSAARCAPENGQQCIAGACVDPCIEAASRRSYLGCEYWPVTLANARSLAQEGLGSFPFAFAIIVANPQSMAVTAYVDGGGLTTRVIREIPAGGLTTIELPWVQGLVSATESTLQPSAAYHLRTTAPVTVYQFNPLTYASMGAYSYSNDASLLLPSTALGRHYTGVTFSDWNMYGGYLTIVGTGSSEAATQVVVTLSDGIRGSSTVLASGRGTTQIYHLSRGDVLHLVGDDGDMTGTTIDATGPIAVYGGHIASQVPIGRVAADHLEEQLLPHEAWGRRYAVTQLIDRAESASVTRIVALRDGTNVTFDPPTAHAPAVLNASAFLEIESTTDFVVSADQPIEVAQFMEGQGLASAAAGDPAMVLEVPIEQYRTEYTFLVPSTYTSNFINVVGRTGDTPTIDGMALTAAPSAIGGSGLSVWKQAIGPGTHRIGTRESTTQYGLKIYGIAPYTSYAYPGGLDLAVINPG